MLTPAWTPLRYHAVQSALWRSPARFVAARAGRGSGKTELARRRVVRFLPVKKLWTNPLYFYALPTFAQAKRVAWKPIKDLIPPEWIAKVSESELTIETVFGSVLHVLGMDKPHRFEGVQWDGGVIDESSDQKPGVFKLNFLPALSHRQAWCWRIGVPKRTGVGSRDFRAAFADWSTDEDPTTAAFTWGSDTVLLPEEIAWAKAHLDERDYNEQYGGTDEELGGLIFYAFGSENVTDQVTYDNTAPLLIGSDFNVNPMCWVVAQRRGGDGLDVIDELFIRNTNTQQSLSYLKAMYPHHQGTWEFYGDAAGKARHTSASQSDYIQIKNDRRFDYVERRPGNEPDLVRSSRVFYPRSNPRQAARWAACNRLLRDAAGKRRCRIHSRCKHLIADLEVRARKEGTNQPDDYGDIGHISDAFGYIIHKLWPVAVERQTSTAAVHTMQGVI